MIKKILVCFILVVAIWFSIGFRGGRMTFGFGSWHTQPIHLSLCEDDGDDGTDFA